MNFLVYDLRWGLETGASAQTAGGLGKLLQTVAMFRQWFELNENKFKNKIQDTR